MKTDRIDQTGYTLLDSGRGRKLEQLGLTDVFLRRADEVVKIPMAGAADSLNVSATAPLYEAFRRRYLAGALKPGKSEAGG